MGESAAILIEPKQSELVDKVMELLPEGGNLNMCLTCGACSSGCPATGMEGMDPRKFLRLAMLGQEDVIRSTPWVWLCTMCRRCVHACPMGVDIPQLVYYCRQSWPREERPKGILGSCEQALNTPATAPWARPARTSSSWSRTSWRRSGRPSPAWKTSRCPSTRRGRTIS